MRSYYNKDYFNKRDHLDLHIAESIKLLATSNQLQTILDVGCGTGRLVKFLNENGFNAYGVDPYAKLPKNKHFIKASATKLTFKSNSFDLVTSISMVEHLTKTEAHRFIEEAKRALKPEGYIFLITPNFNSPLRFVQGRRWFGYSDPTHITFFTPKTMFHLLRTNGFSDVTFRIPSAKNINFDWYLPSFFRKFPMFFKNFLNYLMITSPLSTFRDSFWVVARKK